MSFPVFWHKLFIVPDMKINCPNLNCSSHLNPSPSSGLIVRNGFFYRRSDSRWIRRYQCRHCRKYFSSATARADRNQKKRRINYRVYQLYSSGISQRRLARILGVNPKTIVRKIRFMAALESARHQEFLDTNFKNTQIQEIQFDDLETAEHTKCKPLSVTLAVEPKTRKILNFQVSSMPAKGHLAAVARRKYGYREDQRREKLHCLMKELTPYVSPDCVWSSDENPHYPSVLKAHFPNAQQNRYKGGRGSSTGQGELKKLRFDPLFSLNHTCAMLRANMNRLFRRTWCITKNQRGLIDHLWLYVSYHNRYLTPPIPI